MVHKSERSLGHNALNNNTKQFQLYLSKLSLFNSGNSGALLY